MVRPRRPRSDRVADAARRRRHPARRADGVHLATVLRSARGTYATAHRRVADHRDRIGARHRRRGRRVRHSVRGSRRRIDAKSADRARSRGRPPGSIPRADEAPSASRTLHRLHHREAPGRRLRDRVPIRERRRSDRVGDRERSSGAVLRATHHAPDPAQLVAHGRAARDRLAPPSSVHACVAFGVSARGASHASRHGRHRYRSGRVRHHRILDVRRGGTRVLRNRDGPCVVDPRRRDHADLESRSASS